MSTSTPARTPMLGSMSGYFPATAPSLGSFGMAAPGTSSYSPMRAVGAIARESSALTSFLSPMATQKGDGVMARVKLAYKKDPLDVLSMSLQPGQMVKMFDSGDPQWVYIETVDEAGATTGHAEVPRAVFGAQGPPTPTPAARGLTGPTPKQNREVENVLKLCPIECLSYIGKVTEQEDGENDAERADKQSTDAAGVRMTKCSFDLQEGHNIPMTPTIKTENRKYVKVNPESWPKGIKLNEQSGVISGTPLRDDDADDTATDSDESGEEKTRFFSAPKDRKIRKKTVVVELRAYGDTKAKDGMLISQCEITFTIKRDATEERVDFFGKVFVGLLMAFLLALVVRNCLMGWSLADKFPDGTGFVIDFVFWIYVGGFGVATLFLLPAHSEKCKHRRLGEPGSAYRPFLNFGLCGFGVALIFVILQFQLYFFFVAYSVPRLADFQPDSQDPEDSTKLVESCWSAEEGCPRGDVEWTVTKERNETLKMFGIEDDMFNFPMSLTRKIAWTEMASAQIVILSALVFKNMITIVQGEAASAVLGFTAILVNIADVDAFFLLLLDDSLLINYWASHGGGYTFTTDTTVWAGNRGVFNSTHIPTGTVNTYKIKDNWHYNEWYWVLTAGAFVVAGIHVSIYPLIELIPANVRVFNFGDKCPKFKLVLPVLTSLLFHEIPFLVMRLILWNEFEVECATFIPKNAAMILLGFLKILIFTGCINTKCGTPLKWILRKLAGKQNIMTWIASMEAKQAAKAGLTDTATEASEYNDQMKTDTKSVKAAVLAKRDEFTAVPP